MKRFARGALTLAFWVAVWTALALLVNRELLLPAPWVVVRRLCELAATAAFWRITAVSIGRVLLEIPAGKLDHTGEDMLAAAKRELEEETGLHAQNWQLLVDMDTTPGFCNEHIGIYLATGLSQHHMHTDEDEFLNVDRVPLSEAVRRVMAGEIHDSKTIAGLMMAWNLLGRQSDMPLDSLASIQRGSTAFASQAKE